MRRMIVFIFLLLVSTQAFANARLEQRIYYFSQMTELFRNVCFDPDGTFRENVVMSERGGSIRETAIDCNAQALALDAERQEIEAAMQAAGADCDIQITDPQLAAFASGITDAAQQVQCPGNGGALQCTEALACNLTRSLLPRFTQGVQNFLSGRSPGSSCGSDGGSSCIENLLAGAVFNLRDTGCGIASLFGYNCDSEGSQDSEQASSDAAVMASFQSNEEVASFTENPWAWMKQTASAIFTQIGESITERFGCAQWEDPGRPFMSRCLRPLSWSCADCSAKANMVCGVMGYIGGEILVSFFTGGAVGIVARAASRIAIEAATHFPRTTSLVSRASGRVVNTASNIATLTARWAGRGGASLRNIWEGISSTRGVQVLSSVATRVGSAAVRGGRGAARFAVRSHDFARRRFFAFAATEDLALASVRQFNNLVEESFRAGYRFTGTARASTIENMLGQYPKVSDIRSGAYASQGIRNERDYFRFVTQNMTSEERARFTIGVTRDGADSRVVLIDTTGARAGVGPSYDFSLTPRAPAGATPPPAPRNPDVIVRPPPEIVSEQIVVSGSLRNLDEYPIIEASVRSEADLIRAFGGDTPYNRQLASLAREEYRLPNHFEGAAYDLHDAWMAANPQLRATRPQAFLDYDDLPAAEKLRYADELERAFRESNPALVNSRGFQEYRASLNGSPNPASLADDVPASSAGFSSRDEIADATALPNRPGRAGITVGDSSLQRPPAGTAGQVDDTPVPNPTVRPVDPVTPNPRRQTEIPEFDDVEEVRSLLRPIAEREGVTVNQLLNEIQRGVQTGFNIDRNAIGIARFIERRGLTGDDALRLRDGFGNVVRRRNGITVRNTQADRVNLRGSTQQRVVDCNQLNRLGSTGDAFHAPSGCREVAFTADVRGQYCSCNQFDSSSVRTRGIGPWLTPCASVPAAYLTEMNQADVTALPDKAGGLNRCYKVNVRAGTRCFHGGLGPTFRGFGGLAQMYCGDERTPGEFDSLGPSIRPPGSTNRIEADRYAPIFGDERFLPITNAGRECLDASGTSVCSPEAIERISGMLNDLRRNPGGRAASAAELRDAEIYLQYLRGDVTLDSLGNLRCRNGGGLASGLCSTILRGPSPSGVRPIPSDFGTQRAPSLEVGIADGAVIRAPQVSPGEVRATVLTGPVPESVRPIAPEFGAGRFPSLEAGTQRAPEITLAVAGGLDDAGRIAAAERILGNVSGQSPRGRALIQAHNIAPDRQFGTYTVSDLRRKRSILMYGMEPGELQAYRRANRGQNPIRVFSDAEVEEALRRGLAGNGGASFDEARSLAATRRDQVGRIDRGERVDMDELRGDYRIVASSYESEAFRTTSPQLANEASRFYARSGDREQTLRMLQTGVSQYGMNPRLVLEGLDRDLAGLARTIGSGSNPALTLERETLQAARNEFARRNGLETPAPAQVRTPAPTPRPQPQVQPRPAPPEPQLRPVSEVPVERAQALANDYRLGANGKPVNLERSAELYYRATVRRGPNGPESFARSEARRTSGFNSETAFMRDRNFSAAFDQSFAVDGSLAIRMIDDIAEAGGETRRMSAVNAFLAENFERFNRERFPTPVQRENFRRFVQHVRENYGEGLYGPQRNYLSSWLTRQSE